DLILTMTTNHKIMMQQSYPQYGDKIFTFIEYVSPTLQKDIMDPFGASVEVYRETVNELENYIALLIAKINNEKKELSICIDLIVLRCKKSSCFLRHHLH